MHIVPLADCPQHLETAARWLWDEWHGQYGNRDFEQVRATLFDKPGRPPALLAIDGAPVGVIVFRRVKFHGQEPLRLFINALFVTAEHRRRGIATALLGDALSRVGTEHDTIYVYTHLRDWYQARGFTFVKEEAETKNVVLCRANQNAR